MSWAKVKKTSIDHVRRNSLPEADEENENEVQIMNKIVEGKENSNNVNSENGKGSEEVKTKEDQSLLEDARNRARRGSWAKVSKKIHPAARLSVGNIHREESWIVEERLKSNFYLDDGVSKWKVIYPVANGKRQSPIDIETGKARLDKTLRPLEIRYDQGCCKSVVNTGNSFKVDVEDSITALNGGALQDEFRLIQFHAHWGTTAGAKGSEHTVNGKLYDAELHLVHWNTKHGLFTNAVSKPDGLAVIGVFLEVGNEDHPEIEKVISVFEDIYFKNKRSIYKEDVLIDPAKFLPDDMSYWHYEGSLTTPPLDESVLWHVLRTPIQISKRQLDAMAMLRTGTDKNCVSCIINNFRPPVELGDREVRLFTGEAVLMGSKPNNEIATKETTDTATLQLANEVASLKSVIEELQEEVKDLKSIVENKI